MSSPRIGIAKVGVRKQYDPATSQAVWSALIDSDPVGATWGTGGAPPAVDLMGWNGAGVAK